MTETPVFTKVCALSELPAEGVIGVEVDGEPVAIARAEGQRSEERRVGKECSS